LEVENFRIVEGHLSGKGPSEKSRRYDRGYYFPSKYLQPFEGKTREYQAQNHRDYLHGT
jgi:hypothetical protein